jgi:hypothetical protein
VCQHLEVSRDAAAAVELQRFSCTQRSRVNIALSVQQPFGPCGDLPFTIWGRLQCLRGGADAGLNSCYFARGCGKEYRRGALCTVTLDHFGVLSFTSWVVNTVFAAALTQV